MGILKISKVNTLLVCLMMMAILLNFSSQAQAAQEGDYTYTVTDGQAKVTHYSGHEADVVIPSNLGGFPVTSIGDYAFMYCSGLTNVSIPEGVTRISSGAFLGCSGLTAISIPQTVTSISNAAFSECTGLTTISLPSGITSISNNVFYGCSGLKSINIPQGVTSIGSAAFMYCKSLTSISIPNTTAYIDSLAFWGCGGLTNISVAVDNLNYSSIDGVLFNKAGTILIACPGGLTAISIPQGVTSIGDYAFISCENLTTINIPQTVTSIGHMAFWGCTHLTTISIPEGVTNIGAEAFNSCIGLTTINIPQTVTSIGSAAFVNCTSLTTIIFNSPTTTIYNSPFTIPPATKIIGYATKLIGNDPSTARAYATTYNRTFEQPLPGPMTVSVNATINAGENVVINWTPSDFASKYNLKVWKNTSTKKNTSIYNVIHDEDVTGTSKILGQELEVGNYYLQMTPYNSSGAGPQSNYAFFEVKASIGPRLPIDITKGNWYGLTYPDHDVFGKYQYSAIDINLDGDADAGQNVYAIEDGTINYIAYDHITIKHTKPLTLKNGTVINEWYSMYGHLKRSDKIRRSGQKVSKNDIIGTISNIGADNNHLHFVIYRSQVDNIVNAISPYWLSGFYNNPYQFGKFIYADDKNGTREPAGLYEERIFRPTPTN